MEENNCKRCLQVHEILNINNNKEPNKIAFEIFNIFDDWCIIENRDLSTSSTN